MPRKSTVGGNTHPTTTTVSRVSSWTDGRYRAFVTSALRAAFRKFPNKFAALRNASVGVRVNKRTGREAQHYQCACCKKQFVSKDVQVDHIEPVVLPSVGFISWDTYIERLYCSIDNLQVLCTTCHKKKTASERGKQPCLTNQTTKKPHTSTDSQTLKS